jgi:hypothetical protein
VRRHENGDMLCYRRRPGAPFGGPAHVGSPLRHVAAPGCQRVECHDLKFAEVTGVDLHVGERRRGVGSAVDVAQMVGDGDGDSAEVSVGLNQELQRNLRDVRGVRGVARRASTRSSNPPRRRTPVRSTHSS